jgi:hypothetical protein
MINKIVSRIYFLAMGQSQSQSQPSVPLSKEEKRLNDAAKEEKWRKESMRQEWYQKYREDNPRWPPMMR